MGIICSDLSVRLDQRWPGLHLLRQYLGGYWCLYCRFLAGRAGFDVCLYQQIQTPVNFSTAIQPSVLSTAGQPISLLLPLAFGDYYKVGPRTQPYLPELILQQDGSLLVPGVSLVPDRLPFLRV